MKTCTNATGFDDCIAAQMAPCVSFKTDFDAKRLELLQKARLEMGRRCKEVNGLWECCQGVVDEFLGEPYSDFVRWVQSSPSSP